MSVEIRALGGFGEVGKNMVAIKVDDEVVICDMGLHLPNYITYTEEALGELIKIRDKDLIRVGACADDGILKDWKDKVKGILISHGHLDHVGAVPYLAPHYPKAPVISTTFTIEFIRGTLKGERIHLPNKLIGVLPNGKIKVGSLDVEFIHITHSIPHTAVVCIHTKYGKILYGPDYKLDDGPLLGKPPNYAALEKAGHDGVLVSICDSLNANFQGHTQSEQDAKKMLNEILVDTPSEGKAVIVSTFSSHIARLKTICDLARKMHRRVVFLGRSLSKYVDAARSSHISDFRDVDIVKYGGKVGTKLKQLRKKGMEKFLIVCTGHQGEPKSVLSKIASNTYGFQLKQGDHVVFSSNIIPAKINQDQRAELEAKLIDRGVRLFPGVHVSGHSSLADMHRFLRLIKPQYVLPIHSEPEVTKQFCQMAQGLGYITGETCIMLKNGQTLKLES